MVLPTSAQQFDPDRERCVCRVMAKWDAYDNKYMYRFQFPPPRVLANNLEHSSYKRAWASKLVACGSCVDVPRTRLLRGNRRRSLTPRTTCTFGAYAFRSENDSNCLWYWLLLYVVNTAPAQCRPAECGPVVPPR